MHELTPPEKLFQGEEAYAWRDAGYGGMGKSQAHEDRKTAAAMRPGKRKRLAREQLERLLE